MSRIDEALRRSAAAQRGQVLIPGRTPADVIQDEGELWDFPEERALAAELVEEPADEVDVIDAFPAEIAEDADEIAFAPEPLSELPAEERFPLPPVETIAAVAPPAAVVPAPVPVPPPAAVAPVAAAAPSPMPMPAVAPSAEPTPVRVEPTPARPETPAARVEAAAPRAEASAPRAEASAALAQPDLQPVPADTLITGTNRKDAVEQYRKLAATLHHVQANRGIRLLLCSSAVMAEGKTVTAANLALTLSQSYQRRVLLIDADLRRPRLHTLLNIPNREGLFEALEARSDRRVNVVPVSPWLSVVTAGHPGPDPVHVLTSQRLARVLEDAGSSFDWVIIDTPPVLVLPDAGLLMGLVDAAVLVVGAGQTTYRMAKRAVDALGRDRIVGVVMNRVDDREMQDGYGGYYGYYDAAAKANG